MSLTASRTATTMEIRLPARQVTAWDGGRFYSIGRWGVAVEISPTLFIVHQLGYQPPLPSALVEQLVGHLIGHHQATVLRLHIPFR